jgi:hypothetical protein
MLFDKKISFFLALSLIAFNIQAGCDFKTGSYTSELFNPKFIKKIEVEIPKSAKFAKNVFKILTYDDFDIKSEYKKRFKANISITYDFGVCVYQGKVRQNGDFKDHIKLIEGGKPVMSLDVKLANGNVLGAVKFKLLIPETRNGRNEVLGSLVLRELGFIAPETFEVDVSINGSKSKMLFQENAQKEFLERNLRRENAIFEGDESILWTYQNFKMLDLERLALSRMTNNNWLLKGASSQEISLAAYKRLQNTYLNAHIYHDQFYGDYNENDQWLDEFFFYGVNPNKKSSDIFPKYFFALLSMNGEHAIRPHNQKFYFNSFISEFEPIYYDGNLSFKREFNLPKSKLVKIVGKKIDEEFLLSIKEKMNSKPLKQFFLDRVEASQDTNEFYENAISNFLFKLEVLYEQLNNIRFHKDKFNEAQVPIKEYESLQNKLGFNQKIYVDIEQSADGILLKSAQGNQEKLNVNELSELISRSTLKSKRVALIPTSIPNNSIEQFLIKTTYFPGSIYGSSSVEILEDVKNKVIKIKQSQPNDWILISNAVIDGWRFLFSGISISSNKIKLLNQRFNKYGLTGCLNFYDSTFKNAKIEVSAGACEDSLNIVSSRGQIDLVKIKNSFADAVDIDFSKIIIDQAIIKNAGNDCFDVSGGEYNLLSFEARNCGDKGISVGEKSAFNATSVFISNANIGVSSKDLSNVILDEVTIENIGYCIESSQKKQEFGGSMLKASAISCNGPSLIDEQSLVNGYHEL